MVVLIVLFSFAVTHVTVVSIVTHHLLSFVRYVGTHGGKPFESIEYLFLLAMQAYIIGYPSLGEQVNE